MKSPWLWAGTFGTAFLGFVAGWQANLGGALLFGLLFGALANAVDHCWAFHIPSGLVAAVIVGGGMLLIFRIPFIHVFVRTTDAWNVLLVPTAMVMAFMAYFAAGFATKMARTVPHRRPRRCV
jgi:hypothetical protein